MKKFLLSSIVIIVSFMLVLTGCGSDETTPATTITTQTTATTQTSASTTHTTQTTQTTVTATPTADANMYGGVYHYPLSVAPSTPLGYPSESANDVGPIAGVALERLVLIGDDGTIYPRLATSWDIDPDAKTITYHLRQGVKFTDGSDFTSKDVKWNWDLQIEAGKTKNWDSIDIIDEYTVVLKLKVYQNTSFGIAYPIASKTAFDQHGIEWARENPVGTGPFVFVEHERGVRVYFEKNENYWDTGKPYLDAIEFIVISDDTVRNLAFKRGDIDEFTAAGLDAQELDQLGFPYHQRIGGTFVLIPDSVNADSPLSNLKVRQAISYAIDRESIATNLGYGFANPAYRLYPGFDVSKVNETITGQDTEKAKQLLAEAGYPNGFQTTIYTQTRVVPEYYITALAAMLTDVGINTTPTFPEAGKYTEMRYGGWSNGMMAQALAQISSDNPNGLFSAYFALAFPSMYKSPEWEAAFEASFNSPELDRALVKDVFQIMYDQVMVIPFLEETVMIFQRPGAHNAGLDVAPQQYFWSHLAWLEPDAR